MHWLQIFLKPSAIQLKLGGIQIVERVAKVHQHQIALMPQQRVDGTLPGFLRNRQHQHAASWAISCCRDGLNFRHSGQRKRNI